MTDLTEFNEETQKLLIRFMLSFEELYTISQNIIDPTYFDAIFRPAIRYIKQFVEEYSTLPLPDQIQAETGLSFEKIPDIHDNMKEWYIDEIEKFCRHKAVIQAIEESVDQLEKGSYSGIEENIKQAVLISLHKDIGTNYFEDPQGRIKRLRDNEGVVSTGWKEIDYKLYGGFARNGLHIIAASSGVGKSNVLLNAALNWVEMGLNVVYITLELSELYASNRIDSMLTGIPSREISKNIDNVAMKVIQKGKVLGKLQIKYLNAGSTVNDIRSFLKEYEIQTGIKPDCLVVDYLELLNPSNVQINLSDKFTKDKLTSEELRNLANDLNAVTFSASQLNREAINEPIHDQSHIAGGLSKINTADNVFTLYQSDPMKERGEYMVQFIKTRSSAGVGSNIFLKIDWNTLRITDMDKPAEIEQSNTIVDQLRMKREISRTGDTNDMRASIKENTEIKNLLSRMND